MLYAFAVANPGLQAVLEPHLRVLVEAAAQRRIQPPQIFAPLSARALTVAYRRKELLIPTQRPEKLRRELVLRFKAEGHSVGIADERHLEARGEDLGPELPVVPCETDILTDCQLFIVAPISPGWQCARSSEIELFTPEGALVFSGKLEANARNVNFATRSTRGVPIPATASAPVGGKAEARQRIGVDATKDFSVELEDVAAGGYELVVDGVVRGTINVTTRAQGGTQGEIEFSSDEDDDDGELPLNFDPVGATIGVRQGTTLFYTGLFNPGTSPAAPALRSEVVAVSEALASTGLDPDGSADAELYR